MHPQSRSLKDEEELVLLPGKRECHVLTPPPPPKILPAVFLFVELLSLGLPEESVMWLPEFISEELIFMGLPESLAGSQHSVRRCELGTNKDYRKYR